MGKDPMDSRFINTEELEAETNTEKISPNMQNSVRYSIQYRERPSVW